MTSLWPPQRSARVSDPVEIVDRRSPVAVLLRPPSNELVAAAKVHPPPFYLKRRVVVLPLITLWRVMRNHRSFPHFPRRGASTFLLPCSILARLGSREE